MNEELKKCIADDIYLRNEYLKNKNNGASQEILDGIISQIISNGNKYSELVDIDVNEDQTKKHKIQMIEEYKEDISYSDFMIKADAIMTGILALTSVGTLAFLSQMGGPNGGEVLLPGFAGLGALGFSGALAGRFIEKFSYKKEMKKIIEEYNISNEEGMSLK